VKLILLRFLISRSFNSSIDSLIKEISFLLEKLLYFTSTFFNDNPCPTFNNFEYSSALSLHNVIRIPSVSSLTINPNKETSSPDFKDIVFRLSTEVIIPSKETTPLLY